MLRGSRNPAAKLTEAKVRRIRRLYQKGVRGHGAPTLATKFGVSLRTIQKVVSRETWKDI